ncbi:fasciclin domain-containing protein [Fulvivirga maritima]|uniref:fasciclin domain-containing protein n=1 Tax=Fulvivirga maritima TaxID=2904247 RepID=UPI001F1A31C2|nr:fasciclin domain-containing protein [Fulvivirga maritima]UII25427.1 fasciclin domain-containing protein [Fulvivirga maritima]
MLINIRPKDMYIDNFRIFIFKKNMKEVIHKMSKLFKLMAFSSAILLAACSNDDDNNSTLPDGNMLSTLERNGFRIYGKAIVESGVDAELSDSELFTIFAPKDEFFQDQGVTVKNIGDAYNLREVVLAQIVSGEFYTRDLTTNEMQSLGDTAYTANPANLTVNGAVIADPYNLSATNGVVHSVLDIFIDPTFRIYPKLTTKSELSTFHSVISKFQDIADALNSDDQYTLIAPTNTAFDDYLEEHDLDDIESISETELKRIVQYHIIEDVIYETGDLDSGQLITTSLNEDVQVNIVEEEGNQIFFFNWSEITDANIYAVNGRIHIVDELLMP